MTRDTTIDDKPLTAVAPLRVPLVDDDALIALIAVAHYRGLGSDVDNAENGAARPVLRRLRSVATRPVHPEQQRVVASLTR